MAKKDNFCCVDDFPVMVPYAKLVKMMEIVNNYDQSQQELARVKDQLSALRYQFTELCEKYIELEKSL